MVMKTTKHYIILSLLFFVSITNAQELSKSKMDQIHERKWQFMIENSKLSSSEADAVYPIFLEYERVVWAQHIKTKSLYKSLKTNVSNSKPDYVALNNNYAEMDLLQGRLFKAYHLKLQKVLQPEVLFKYYHAEREFKRKLLLDIQGRPSHELKK